MVIYLYGHWLQFTSCSDRLHLTPYEIYRAVKICSFAFIISLTGFHLCPAAN